VAKRKAIKRKKKRGRYLDKILREPKIVFQNNENEK